MRERMGWYEGRGEGGKEREHAYEKAQGCEVVVVVVGVVVVVVISYDEVLFINQN